MRHTVSMFYDHSCTVYTADALGEFTVQGSTFPCRLTYFVNVGYISVEDEREERLTRRIIMYDPGNVIPENAQVAIKPIAVQDLPVERWNVQAGSFHTAIGVRGEPVYTKCSVSKVP